MGFRSSTKKLQWNSADKIMIKDQISFQPFSFNPDTRFGDKGILKFSFLKLKPIKCWLSLSSQTWSLLMFTLVPNPSLGQRTIPLSLPGYYLIPRLQHDLCFDPDQTKCMEISRCQPSSKFQLWNIWRKSFEFNNKYLSEEEIGVRDRQHCRLNICIYIGWIENLAIQRI